MAFGHIVESDQQAMVYDEAPRLLWLELAQESHRRLEHERSDDLTSEERL
jgi:hypothetical protein